jgi:carboxypeptidase T
MIKLAVLVLLVLGLFGLPPVFAHDLSSVSAHENSSPDMQWAAIRAKDKTVRTALVNGGFSIENVVEDMSYGYAPESIIDSLAQQGFEVVSHFPVTEFKATDFPDKDSLFHNYAEMNEEMAKIAQEFPGLVSLISMGRSLEGREMQGLRINAHAKGLEPSSLPGIIFMGGHHAREHISVEVPLKLARYLASGFETSDTIRNLVQNRDIYIFPSINPDGSEFDIADGRYKSWRKNRQANSGSSCAGVDLNRNYGYHWGTGGSSTNPCSEVYMGAGAFSEPETQNVKTFVESRPNLKVLLTFHTFSELILYPWGYTYDDVTNPAHLSAFRTMAQTMAGWNGYTPQPSSDLYITSGDTVDWAYGTLGIFAFTFELSPRDMWGGGGFYPGQSAIEPTFQANIKPALYLIDLADDPLRAAFRPETTLFYGK